MIDKTEALKNGAWIEARKAGDNPNATHHPAKHQYKIEFTAEGVANYLDGPLEDSLMVRMAWRLAEHMAEDIPNQVFSRANFLAPIAPDLRNTWKLKLYTPSNVIGQYECESDGGLWTVTAGPTK